MDEEFTQIVDGLKQKKTEVKNRKQSLTDQRITVAGLDAVQRAVVESIKVLTQALLNETLSVNVTNNLQSIETPDALTGADVVRAAIKDLQWTMSQKETDLSPVVDQLTAVLKAVEKLPTEFPEDKEFPTELAVNNLSSVVDEIKTLTDQVKAIELQPNITVTPAEVTVEAPVVNVMIDEQLGRLEEAILQLKPAEVVDNLLDTMLVDQMRAVEEAVRSIKFPVPNNKPVFVSSDNKSTPVNLTSDGRVPVEIGSILPTATLATERYDIQGTIIYVGSAPIGTSDSTAQWTISKYDLGDLTNASGKVGTNLAWTNRTSGTYS